MSSDAQVVEAYLDHLTRNDLGLLRRRVRGVRDDHSGDEAATLRLHLRERPHQLAELLSDDGVFEAVFGGPETEGDLVSVSPFLVFAVAVHRAAAHLATTPYVTEWLGWHRRAAVFDVEALRDFLADPWRRLFLAELLASYTHVASGSVFVSTRRGWRRQRFSELDPVRLAGLLEVVPEAERPGIFRRLGDLALFLVGVFPDYVSRRGFGPIEVGRLRRAGAIAASTAGRRSFADGDGRSSIGHRADQSQDDTVALLERLGPRWYRAAVDSMTAPMPVTTAVIRELPERFSQARRILNLMTDRFLFAQRDRWFGGIA